MFYFPVVLAIFVWLWPRLWFRVVRDKIELSVSLSASAVEIGEQLMITATVRNRSWLPCPFVMLSLDLPHGLSCAPDSGVYVTSRSTFLLMRQEITFSVHCYGHKRGLQNLRHRDVIIRMNEGLGLRELFLRREISGAVVVYPRQVGAQKDIQALRDINGELERTRWLLPDESLLRGIRSYATGDPFKHIAWHATAKTGSWMTKQFSSSTDVSVGVVVNAQFVDPHWLGTKVAVFDELCAFANAFARDLERRRVPMYFASNAIYPGGTTRQWYQRQSAPAIKHLLGSMLAYTNGDFRSLLRHTLAQLPADSPLVVFTGFLTDVQAQILATAAKTRYVYLFAPENSELPVVQNARVVYFRSEVAEDLQMADGEVIEPGAADQRGAGGMAFEVAESKS